MWECSEVTAVAASVVVAGSVVPLPQRQGADCRGVAEGAVTEAPPPLHLFPLPCHHLHFLPLLMILSLLLMKILLDFPRGEAKANSYRKAMKKIFKSCPFLALVEVL